MNTRKPEPDAAHPTRIRALAAALQQAAPAQAESLMREALQALVADQQAALAAGVPPFEAGALSAALALFPEYCVAREFGIRWTDAEQATWQRVCGLLVAAACEQPIGDELVVLLRHATFDWDEAQEIDWAVRWWDAARRAGLPVPDDFGECWRAHEWLGLLHDLTAVGRACRAKQADAEPQPPSQTAEELPRLLAHASRVALRYGPLKPLLRLLEPLSGARVSAGFTF
jgi:aminoglycoside/choline kinase family phosphotransferase